MRIPWAVVPLLVVTTIVCGRIGFDPEHETGDASDNGDSRQDSASSGDGAFGDGPPATSCAMLANTCGATGNAACCESPVVVGGTFGRSYDLTNDGAYLFVNDQTTVSTFRFDKYEVTVGRFRQFIAAGKGTQLDPPTMGAGSRTLNGMVNVGGWDSAWNANLAANTYPQNPCVDCANLTADMYRLTRGGSFMHNAGVLRNGFRYNEPPGFPGHYIGFRCARPL